MARAFIGVGSNIDPETNVRKALQLLAHQVRIVGISTFYRTPPLGRPDQPPFWNGVVDVDTDILPIELKHNVLQEIEDELGRVRTEDKYAPRTIDLDIIIYGNIVIASSQLTIPDPGIARRAFLALPLCELAPDLIVPGMGKPICDMADSLSADDMEPLPEYTALLREDLQNEY